MEQTLKLDSEKRMSKFLMNRFYFIHYLFLESLNHYFATPKQQ